MTLMNIQSNASGTYVETVALLAAVDSCVSTKRRLEILDEVLHLLMSPSMPSLVRTEKLRVLLNNVQSFVEFVGGGECVPLDPALSSTEKSLDKISSSKSTTAKGIRLAKKKYCQKLEHYVLEVLKQTTNS